MRAVKSAIEANPATRGACPHRGFALDAPPGLLAQSADALETHPERLTLQRAIPAGARHINGQYSYIVALRVFHQGGGW
jgi:hypothetical protein